MRDFKSTLPGCDKIRIRTFKDNMDFFGITFLHIWNQSHLQGTFPAQLKRAKTVPVFKSGDRRELENYRTLSMLNSFSKFFEKLAYLQLYSYLTGKKNILSPSQIVFCSGSLTDNAINSMSRRIYEALIKREYSVCIMIELSKTFDTLDRIMLLNNLEYYGKSNKSLLWFQSYLSEHDHFDVLNSIASSCSKFDLGLGQERQYKPLLFVFLINDTTQSSSFLDFFFCWRPKLSGFFTRSE